MMCIERGDASRSNKFDVPSSFLDKIAPTVAKMWNPLLPNISDSFTFMKHLLAEEEQIACQYNNGVLANIYDSIFRGMRHEDHTRGYNLLKTLEFDTSRIVVPDCSNWPLVFGSSILNNFPASKQSRNTVSSSLQIYEKPFSMEGIKLNLIASPSCELLSFPLTMMSANTELSKVGTADHGDVAPESCQPLNIEPDSTLLIVSTPQKTTACVISPPRKRREIATMEIVNKHLVDRKSKEMNKLSKKRRRRQKKRKPCTQGAKISSHVMKTEDKSKDEGVPKAHVEDSDSSSDVEFSFQCADLPIPPSSSVSFFFERVINSGSDDDDWDEDDTTSVTIVEDFEFPDLMTGISSVHIGGPALNFSCLASVADNYAACHIDVEFELSPELICVNEKWTEMTSDVPSTERRPVQVSFAEDERLVTQYPIEMYERKGEWEIYALERFRFQRRIQEVERILAACLTPEHRAKVQQQQKSWQEL